MSSAVMLSVSNLKCGGCVARATETLERVPGVTRAVVDLASKTAKVEGTAGSDALRMALQQAGYPATLLAH